MLNELGKYFEFTILLCSKTLGFKILSKFCIWIFFEMFW
jgi:hypothetical protein